MLRKFAYNRIFRTTGMLVLFLLLILFPASNQYSLDDVVKSTSNNETKKEVYLIDKDNYIGRTKVSLTLTNDNKNYATKLIELLIIGGKYEEKIPNGFKALLPADTKINSLKIEEDSIYLDISSDILELKTKKLKQAMELITYNLTTIEGIEKVYLKIDGKIIENINYPLSRENGINKSCNVTNYKNVNLTTIYFLNKNNTGYYYVPVTKVNNDNREKIKIIVDELTSSHIYETNLMSFLNYNTKLIDYKINDEVLVLNFNKFLFDNEETNSILEEVIYSISLSVRDNYDVKEVVFTVNGDEITKSVLKNIE